MSLWGEEGCIRGIQDQKNRLISQRDQPIHFWRCRADSNRRVRALQAPALPLGHGTQYQFNVKVEV